MKAHFALSVCLGLAVLLFSPSVTAHDSGLRSGLQARATRSEFAEHNECNLLLGAGGREVVRPEKAGEFDSQWGELEERYSQENDKDVHVDICDASRPHAKILLFGGSFNPPHVGHLLRAIHAYESTGYDCVWFLPAATHPDKPNLLPQEDRISMIRRTIHSYPFLDVSSIEKLNPVGFTFYTVKGLKEMYPTAEFGWLAGGDVYRSMPSWDGGIQTLREVNMVITSRDSDEDGKNYVNEDTARCYAEMYDIKKRVEVLNYAPTLSSISSTVLRNTMTNNADSIGKDLSAGADNDGDTDQSISDFYRTLKQLCAKGLWWWFENHRRGMEVLQLYASAHKETTKGMLEEL